MSSPERARPGEAPEPHRASARYPFPSYPSGWYAVAFSRDLPPGALLPLHLFGRELVAFRTRSGEAAVADAYCPHMGAHLGHGGSVAGECVRCPFHGFEFDTRGECVATPYPRNQPPRARLATWPVLERDGALLAYHDELGRAPEWEPPTTPIEPGWGRPMTRRFDVATHPQETTENAVDIGHLAVVHGYRGIETLEALRVDGPHLTVRYAVHRADAFLRPSASLRAEFEISIAGLGWSRVDVSVPELGFRSRQFVYATPVDGESVQLRAQLTLGPLPKASRVHPLLALVPPPLARGVVARLAFRAFLHDLRQDFAIWSHKRYVDPPALAPGDGPLGRYRQWARQFYVSEPS